MQRRRLISPLPLPLPLPLRGSLLAAAAATVLLAASCGGDASVSARLGWRFDYRDWTSASTSPDLRGCDNQPAAGASAPYLPVTSVRLLMDDPDGQVAEVDDVYDCGQGAGGATVPIRGMAAKLYSIVLEAADANGVVYRLEDSLDLSAYVEQTFDLLAAVGELDVLPRFPGTGTLSCPEGVSSVRFEMTEIVNGTPASSPSVSGVQAACDDDGVPSSLLIRDIPVHPIESFSGSYLPTTYRLHAVAVAADATELYCSDSTRAIRPGNANAAEDVVFGTCN